MRKNHFFALMVSLFFGLCNAAAQELTATFNPENESQLEELTSFQITFNKEMVMDAPEYVRVKRNGVRVSGVTVSISEDKKTVTYTLTEPQAENGTYTFSQLSYAVHDAAYEIENLDLDELTYYIGEPQELEPLLFTSPDPSRQIQALDEILLMFENVKTIEVNNEKAVYLTNGTDTYDYYLSPLLKYKQVYALPKEEGLSLTKAGDYTLVIEEGALILNGKEYGYNLKFTVTEEFVVVSSIPAAGFVKAEDLEHITVTLNKEVAGFTSYMVKSLLLRKIDAEGNAIGDAAGYIPSIDPADARIIHLDVDDYGVDIDEPGAYTLFLPPTLFIAKDGSKNVFLSIEYEIGDPSSILGVERKAENAVYNLQGMKTTGRLPGLYIIHSTSGRTQGKNSKKVLKK